MSSVNYNLRNKGLRVVDSQDAWVVNKKGNVYLNPKYKFLGKVEMTMPNIVVSASGKQKPVYRGDVADLPIPAKKQIVAHRCMTVPISFVNRAESTR